MLPPLLDALAFRANTATHRPIIAALALIKAHRDSRRQHFVVDGTVPIDGVIPPHWRELVMEHDASGTIRVNRINYDLLSAENDDVLKPSAGCNQVTTATGEAHDGAP
jgi:hypothetical protein